MCKITNLIPQQLYSTTCWACYSDTITCLSEVLLYGRYVYIAMKLCIALHKTSLLTSTLFLGTSFSHHSHSRGLDGQEIMWPSSSLLVSSTPQLLGHLTILYPQLTRWSCKQKIILNYWLPILSTATYSVFQVFPLPSAVFVSTGKQHFS